MKTLLKEIRIAFAVALAILAAGCGGGGATDSSIASRLSLAPGAGYNGSTSPLQTGRATTVTQNGHTTATISSGGRTLVVDMIATELHAGDTFDVGVDGTTATYTEVRDRDPQTFTWVGTGGRIKINAITGATQADIDVTGVNFTADASIQANPALGSFTLTGHVNGIPISGGGGIGGQASLSFSNPINTNADLSSFNGGLIGFAQVQENGTLSITTGTGDSLRVLSVILSQNAAAGDVIDLSVPFNGKATVGFVQGASDPTKVWAATSGTLKVVSRTATTAKVQFTNVKFTNVKFTVVGQNSSATGTFVLNGTLARRP